MKKILYLSLLMAFSSGLVAQDKIPIIEKYEPGAILKVGLAPVGFMNHTGAALWNVSLASEFRLGDHFTVQAQLLSNLGENMSSGIWDLEFKPKFDLGQGNILGRNRISLNADIRYYLSGNKAFNGTYLGIRVNNLVAGMEQFSEGAHFYSTQSLPAIGGYIGYQKIFKNNMFIDANIGYVPEDQFRYVKNDFDLPLDVNLSIGFRFKIGKDKEEE